MPRYDYRCEPCQDTFEIVRSAEDRTEVCCPTCGEAAKRVFSPVGVVFKGSGFHSTDYRAKPGAESKETAPCGESSSACEACPAKSAEKKPSTQD
jgi:putative FmdB family regulatory protein